MSLAWITSILSDPCIWLDLLSLYSNIPVKSIHRYFGADIYNQAQNNTTPYVLCLCFHIYIVFSWSLNQEQKTNFTHFSQSRSLFHPHIA